MMIQEFSTISSTEIEIEKSVYSNSIVLSIDLDILNLGMVLSQLAMGNVLTCFIGCLKALYHCL